MFHYLLKIRTGPAGLQAAGPSRAAGRQAVVSRGPRVVAGHGSQAAGPLGRWAVAGRGPLGHGPAFSKTLSN